MAAKSAKAATARVSVVDSAEISLREWLGPGNHRPGDRLPPEQEIATMLGISRGTLRLALERLAANGEIVRRQGSGTYVGRVAVPAAFSEGLEVLESYASLAKRQGHSVKGRDVTIAQRRAPGFVAEALNLRKGSNALCVERTLLVDRAPAAHMRDWIHPSVPLPSLERLTADIENGQMMLDIVIGAGVPVAFARTGIRPRLLEPGEEVGAALGVTRTTGALEITETIHINDGDAVQYSIDVFPPGAIDLHVLRGVGDRELLPVSARSSE
ncbi:MAG: GntR family transcriptional regulator [Actinomycetes bacterium]